MKTLFALILLALCAPAQAQFVFTAPTPPKIEQQSPDRPTLYGDVNDRSAARVINAIHAANRIETDKPIHLFLQSPGGSVMAGGAIISAMAVSRRPVHTVVVGACASMCAMIAEHGSLRIILPHAYLMFHNASIGINGELPHVAGQLAMIMRIWEANEEFVAKRIGLSLSALRMHEAMQWWLTADECVQARTADAVANPSDYVPPEE